MSRSLMTKSRRQFSQHGTRLFANEQMFVCIHCHLPVSCSPDAAGVQNRNHCPCCLWSRHLDWRIPGDRLATCRAPMQPVGFTTKRSRNKYARERDGELMLIHCCSGCDTLVINRVAADDHPDSILAVFDHSPVLIAAHASALAADGVAILTAADHDLVRQHLFGSSGTRIAAFEPLEQ